MVRTRIVCVGRLVNECILRQQDNKSESIWAAPPIGGVCRDRINHQCSPERRPRTIAGVVVTGDARRELVPFLYVRCRRLSGEG